MREIILCEFPAIFGKEDDEETNLADLESIEIDYVVLDITKINAFNRSTTEQYTRISLGNGQEMIIDMQYEDFKKFLISKGIGITSISEVLTVEKIEQ